MAARIMRTLFDPVRWPSAVAWLVGIGSFIAMVPIADTLHTWWVGAGLPLSEYIRTTPLLVWMGIMEFWIIAPRKRAAI
jgi:hypothetical protein